MIDWKAQLRTDADYAKHILLTTGEVKPMFILHCPTGIQVIGSTWRNLEEKRIVQGLVAMQAAIEDADAVVFIAEAWAREIHRRNDESAEAFRRRVSSEPPSEAKDRIEVIMISVVYREDGEIKPESLELEIKRDKKGKPIDAVRRANNFSTKPMFNLLRPNKLNDFEREMVRDAMEMLQKKTGYMHEVVNIHKPGHA
jgi:hypothetical protein